MTQRIYYEDVYKQEFDAQVISCRPVENGYEVILNQTAFYPEGGGQPCDLGILETADGDKEVSVTDVQEGGEEVLHICSAPLEAGTRVHGQIDWERRLTYMREHSGEHIISGIICRTHGYSNIGFHIGKDYVTIDFSGLLTEEEIVEAERRANAKVLENVEISAEYPDKETLAKLDYRSKKELDGAIRIVTVPGADVCACCGTHVARTGEIGMIKVIGSEHYKNGIRLNILIGEKALADYTQRFENVRKISTLLSVKPENTAEAVEKLQESMNALKLEYGALKMQLLEQKVDSVAEGEKSVVLFEKGLTPVDMRKLADRLQAKAEFAAVFCGSDEEGYKYVICGKADVAAFGKEFNRTLNGRGGGKNPMIQGSVSASRVEIEAFLAQKNGERRMVFFDVDGTILDGPTHTIPDSAVQAIRKLRENGNLAFLNTGRTMASIEKSIRDIGFDGYVCGCGTHIYYDGKVLFAHSIPHEKCVEIIYKLRELRISAFFEAPTAVYIDSCPLVLNPAMEQVRKDFKRVGLNTQDFPEDLEGSDFTFDKFYCVYYEKSDFEGLKEYVKGEFSVTPQGPGNLEFVPAGCSKAEGIHFLAEKFGIALENCYAIGDSENDLPMLQAVPNSIAMGVCAPAILPCCSYQTAPVLEDGIEKALKHYGLI